MRDNLSTRPRVKLERTLADYIGEVFALAGVFALLFILALSWTALPGEIPRHFGLSGEPTAWSGRWSLIVPMGIALAIYIGFTLLNRAPHIFNFPWPITEQNARVQYRLARSMMTWLKALIVWMFALIAWSQVRVAHGESDTVSPFMIMGFLIGIHVVLGVFLYRAYRWRDGDPESLQDQSIQRPLR
jgi:low affinity Fe/Cu permease